MATKCRLFLKTLWSYRGYHGYKLILFPWPGDLEFRSRSPSIEIDLRISVVHMWLKNKGSSSRRYEFIALTCQFCFHDLAILKLGQGAQIVKKWRLQLCVIMVMKLSCLQALTISRWGVKMEICVFTSVNILNDWLYSINKLALCIHKWDFTF